MRKYILNSAKGKKLLTGMLEKKNISNINDSILESAINKLDDNSVTKIMDKLVNESKIHDIEFYSNFLKKQFGENSNIYKNAIESYLDKLKNYFGEDSDIYKDAVKTLNEIKRKEKGKKTEETDNRMALSIEDEGKKIVLFGEIRTTLIELDYLKSFIDDATVFKNEEDRSGCRHCGSARLSKWGAYRNGGGNGRRNAGGNQRGNHN